MREYKEMVNEWYRRDLKATLITGLIMLGALGLFSSGLYAYDKYRKAHDLNQSTQKVDSTFVKQNELEKSLE